MVRRPLVVLVVTLAVVSVATLGSAQVSQAERDALLALYDATGGPSWTEGSGWGGAAGSECDWHGVECYDVDGAVHVWALWLGGNGLTGQIPTGISGLSSLVILELFENQLTGAIPSSIGDMSRLHHLSLGNNDLTGPIPASLGGLEELLTLDAAENRLSGPIPPEIGSLVYLIRLSLADNQLSGAIPSTLGQMDRLEWLDLSSNRLTGSIPADLASLGSLQALVLWGNQLSGTVPAFFGQMSGLEWLELSGNRLTGPIPTELGNITGLRRLGLYANQLSGSIPAELGQLSNLVELDLGDNELTGFLPPELGQLSSLRAISVQSNRLVGELPDELAGWTTMESLWVADNDFSGELPTWLFDLENLVELNAWGNSFSGSIPPEIVRLDTLQVLNLGDNRLTGTIPDALSGLTKLSWLALHGNDVTGTIPSWIGSLANLEGLFLGWNQLTGVIPSNLGNLSSLQELSLDGNQLTGAIPTSLGQLANLRFLGLGWNQLSGPIPASLGGLAHLEGLWLEGAGLSGSIPPELGNLIELRYLQLAQNQLAGSIPAELGNLENLQGLGLYLNQLSGSIPPELGDLQNVQYMWLSLNRLTGEIPAELGQLDSLLELGVDLNSLSGQIPPELGDLALIERLWLGGNQLEGEVPPELAQLTTLVDGDGLELRWNLLTSDDPTLEAFLSMKHVDGGDWRSFQTVPPENLAAVALGPDAVELSWDPIPYSWDEGGYQILASTSAGGSYQEVGRTETKEVDTFVVAGLEPETTYFLVLRTATLPHGANFNTLISDPSEVVSATTEAGAACQVSCQAAAPATASTDDAVAFTGEVVVTGCDLEAEVRWWFGDGQTADTEDASHAYAFPGAYQWSFGVRAGSATCTDSGMISVSAPDADCGNGICEEGETAWTCEADCGFGADETGRVMGGGTDFVVPAAVGGVAGAGGTFWVSEAMLLNPGTSAATVQAVFTPDAAPGSPVSAAPMTVPAGGGMFWSNYVESAFSDTRNGSVRAHSDQPVVFVSRTFNDLPDGTYGQFLGAVERSRAAGPGTAVFLIGLSHDAAFRTNLILQEVAGIQTAVEVTVFDGDGDAYGSRSVTVAAGAKLQKNLAFFDGDGLENGYVQVEVISGGQVVAIASVVDQQTGDAMTVDALHPTQVTLDRSRVVAAKSTSPVSFTWSPQVPVVGQTVQFTDLSDPGVTSWAWNFGDGETSREQHPTHVYTSAGTYSVVLNVSGGDIRAFTFKQVQVVESEEAGSVFLLPVVARLAGAAGTVWRTDAWIMNPFTASQQLRLEYRAAGVSAPMRQQLSLGPGELLASEDVVGTLFPSAGDGKGSLAIEAPDGVFVSSRTYNLGSTGTFGQAVPALAVGDLVASSDADPALLPKIKSTSDFRCNIGFTDAAGQGAAVEVVLYAVTSQGLSRLATKRFTVAAWENKQIDRIFQNMGATGSHEAAAATVEVVSGGPVYAYASNVDNRTGDAEFIPAMRP